MFHRPRARPEQVLCPLMSPCPLQGASSRTREPSSPRVSLAHPGSSSQTAPGRGTGLLVPGSLDTPCCTITGTSRSFHTPTPGVWTQERGEAPVLPSGCPAYPVCVHKHMTVQTRCEPPPSPFVFPVSHPNTAAAVTATPAFPTGGAGKQGDGSTETRHRTTVSPWRSARAFTRPTGAQEQTQTGV